VKEELIAKLMWNSGGAGYGVCAVAGAMLWGMDQPTETRPDLISIVAIGGSPCEYSDIELKRLVEFSEAATANYDKRWRYRRGANLICISKHEDSTGVYWMRKRMSWTMGSLFSPTLDEALAIFEREWAKPQEVGNETV
jgi:hypothetical protein